MRKLTFEAANVSHICCLFMSAIEIHILYSVHIFDILLCVWTFLFTEDRVEVAGPPGWCSLAPQRTHRGNSAASRVPSSPGRGCGQPWWDGQGHSAWGPCNGRCCICHRGTTAVSRQWVGSANSWGGVVVQKGLAGKRLEGLCWSVHGK